MSWQATVERTVNGLGYDVVECERSSQGLLRVYIDRVPGQRYDTGEGDAVTVEDCERVTRQLQRALEVDAFDYRRLEVSSPGLDRPLHRASDYQRFSGNEIEVTLKLPFQGRRKYRGVLVEGEGGFELVFKDGAEDKVLGFALDEVREARLVPVVDFKRKRAPSVEEAEGPDSDISQDSRESQEASIRGEENLGRPGMAEG